MSKKVALVVEFSVKPELLSDFVELMQSHAALTLKSEPGCEKFEVLVPQENDNCIFLYELYTDSEAVEEHMNSELLASTRGSYDNMINSKRVVWCDVV